MPDMKRREFIALLGGGGLLLATKVMRARAQQPAMPVIGFLSGSSLAERRPVLSGFRQALAEAGYVEGQNIAIEYRWVEGQYDRLPALAAELVRRQVAVVVAGDGPSALAAKAATTTIPVVFSTGIEPIQAGLVTSLSRPGGNLTGFNLIAGPLPAKQLGLLHELVPAAGTIAMLINPTNANAERDAATVQDAARAIGVQILVTRPSLKAISSRCSRPLFASGPELFSSIATSFSPAGATKSSRWRPATRCPSCLHGGNTPWPAAWSATDPAFWPRFVRSAFTPARSSKAPSRPICRSCSRPRSSW
jgi:putative ABC transport system substrate-binding protein